MHRGSRPRRLLDARRRAGLASTIGPVLVGVIFAFAWNMAGSHGAAMPQPGPGLAPTVGTAVDQAADQAWASVMPTATRLPDRYASPPAGSGGLADTNCHRVRPSRGAHATPAVDSAHVSACATSRRIRQVRKTASARSDSTAASSAHRRSGHSNTLILVVPTRETGAEICRTCRWLIGRAGPPDLTAGPTRTGPRATPPIRARSCCPASCPRHGSWPCSAGLSCVRGC